MSGTGIEGIEVAVGVRPNLSESDPWHQFPLHSVMSELERIDVARSKIICASNVVGVAMVINGKLQSGIADPNRVVISEMLPTNSRQDLYESDYERYIEPLMGGLQAVIFVAAQPRHIASWLPRMAMTSDEYQTLEEGEAIIVRRENGTLLESIIKRGAK